jgi:hypothetical protein
MPILIQCRIGDPENPGRRAGDRFTAAAHGNGALHSCDKTKISTNSKNKFASNYNFSDFKFPADYGLSELFFIRDSDLSTITAHDACSK